MEGASIEYEQLQYEGALNRVDIKRILWPNASRGVFGDKGYFLKRSCALKKSAGLAIFFAKSALISFRT